MFVILRIHFQFSINIVGIYGNKNNHFFVTLLFYELHVFIFWNITQVGVICLSTQLKQILQHVTMSHEYELALLHRRGLKIT